MPTRRIVSSELEKILYEPIKILDHGFIRVIDYMGTDSSIVQAARVSYGKGTKQTNQDKGLINYLMRHKHTTPFEMCDIKFHVKLPIFVARQWIRHRTASVNEYSARYSILGSEFYIPEKQQLSAQSSINKQGRADNILPDDYSNKVLGILRNDALQCYEHYIELMNENDEGNVINENGYGIARELARMNLTLNYYTEWYWKINLHNLLHFVRLRADSHAQYEIRVYAQVILDIIKKWVPYTFDAFEEYSLEAVNLSRSSFNIIKKMLNGEEVKFENSSMTKREWNELMKLLDKNSEN
ncbi:MAG: FAD-dependent thymidylate synthase [Rickettsiaceae bacterium]|nr:FAD-dependent thymidylate synthase [Rickettsiaceae bacterium]